MDLESLLINSDRYDYKCFDELKRLIRENESFRNILIKGYEEGKITGFSEEIWDLIHSQNIRNIPNFEDVFRDGANIGYCTVASKQLSYSFNECMLCGGMLPILKGTRNCPDGSHTWLLVDKKVIDTTLMLIIDEDYSKKMGYVEENRYNPNNDSIYLSTKYFTLDKTITNRNR